MRRIAKRILSLAGGPLLWANLAVLVVLKVFLPIGISGLADIGSSLRPLDADSVVVAVNAARQEAGMESLIRNSKLDAAAQARLEDMAVRQYFAHRDPDGLPPWGAITHAGYRFQSAGENLARGFSDPWQVVPAWVDSPAHPDNLMSDAYTEYGTAVGRVVMDGVETTLVVQLFASPLFAPVVVTPAPQPYAISTEPSVALVEAETSVAPATEVAGIRVARVPS